MATVARGDAAALAAANAAFDLQVFRGDSGWNQNAMDAALLGHLAKGITGGIARSGPNRVMDVGPRSTRG